MSEGRFVIGIDSSTQSTKAVVWDREGTAVAEGRSPIPASTPEPGHVEQDVEDWWRACVEALREALAGVDPARLDGLAISNQRETSGFLNADGQAVAPALIWLDERGSSEIERLSEEVGAETLHRLSGKPVDLTPVVYRLSWLRHHAPEVLDRSARIVDVHGFLTGRLTGTVASSWTSADPWGVLDIVTKDWSRPLLAHLGLRPEQFGTLFRPGKPVGRVSEAAAEETGLPKGLTVYAAGGDGQCAGLGADATRPGCVYLNLGTAVVTGAWSPDPALAPTWRTMISPTGVGYFLEGVQRAGTFFLNWLADALSGGRHEAAVLESLESRAAALPIGSEGVLVCPYLSGCMDPHWDSNARATFTGLAPHHGPAHLYRASLESLTLESARCIEAMAAHGLRPSRIVAVGGGAQSDLWLRMTADATGLPVIRSRSIEASALGAGMTAAVGAGWFPDFDSAARAMSQTGETFEPDPLTARIWRALSERQAAVYERNR